MKTIYANTAENQKSVGGGSASRYLPGDSRLPEGGPNCNCVVRDGRAGTFTFHAQHLQSIAQTPTSG